MPTSLRPGRMKSLKVEQKRKASFSHKIARALILLFLSACTSALVQLNLAPVYGAKPAAYLHVESSILAIVTFLLIQFLLRPDIDIEGSLRWLPLHALTIPALLHSPLYGWSARLGPMYGPFVTESLTSLLLVGHAFMAFAEAFQSQRRSERKIAALSLGGALMMVPSFMFLETFVKNNVYYLFLLSPYCTRASMLFIDGCLYAFCFPSRLLLGATPSIIYALLASTHMPWQTGRAELTYTLWKQGYSLLERRESLTGYISVLENKRDQFRVLRCDHSLLGGEWLATEERRKDGIIVPETIYSAFTMLEAVRMIQSSGAQLSDDSDASALIIGLGIGTCAKAFAAHGINTTVVELDPIVIEMSRKYFSLQDEVTTIAADAVRFAKTASEDSARYDYIIHDVFTGGAEPAALFTVEFLQYLRKMMKPGGAISINYTGDLKLQSAAIVIKTITSVFHSCKAFRDSPDIGDANTDFANLVIYCTREKKDWSFRSAVEADFLQSQSRFQNLPPQHELSWVRLREQITEETPILRQFHEAVLDQYSRKSSLGHWRIMRLVMPSEVWNAW